jgi:hypothetical protein
MPRQGEVVLALPTKRGSRSLRRTIVIALALATLSVAAAACGGSPGASVANLGPSTSTTSPPPGSGGTASQGSGVGGKSPGGGSSQATIGIGGVTVQFSQCMRTHGVPNFPDPNGQGQITFSGVDPGSASFQAAERACAKYAPGGGKHPTPAQQQAALAEALKYSRCMRSHGIADFPDPQTQSGGGIGIRIHGGPNSDLDPSNPHFKAAQQACQSLMLGGGGLGTRSADK